eukprot:TRINITY_DN17783_c0_g1_i1.p1 TRINITY_DN17783_c0_g1~~TRINITY_DN17783_c0_g1_i1.p1  ORF type:complete len:1044 (-),score=343.49 TRINITY_DN17783_c0_g1_i1:92-3223(-)
MQRWLGTPSATPGQMPPGGLASVEDPTDVDKKKAEAELEAERLWWSEASERQVKELESQFGEEFQKTTGRLRADIAAAQDRLEMLVETEKQQRHASMVELRRDLDRHQVAMADVQRLLREWELERGTAKASSSLQTAAAVAESQLAHEVREASDLMTRLASSQDSQKVQLAAAEAALRDLRRDFEERQSVPSGLEKGHVDLQLEELRRDLECLRENTQLQAKSSQEVHALHQVIMQSAGDLGRGIEEVSAAVVATETKMRQDLVTVKTQLEAHDERQGREILQAFELLVACQRADKQLIQSAEDEKEKRDQEANVLQARLDAFVSQLEDLQGGLASLKATQREPAMLPQDSLRPLEEGVIDLRSRLKRLESTVAQENAGESSLPGGASSLADCAQRAQATATAAGERAGRLEARLAEEIEQERRLRMEAFAEFRRQLEDLAVRAASRGGESEMAALAVAEKLPSSASSQEMLALRTELSAVTAIAQLASEEARSGASIAAQLQAEFDSLGGSAGGLNAMLHGLGPRVQALEERSKQLTNSVLRLEADDMHSPEMQAAKEAERQRLEGEVQRLVHDAAAVEQRLSDAEADVKKACREAGLSSARIAAAESDIKKLLRDFAAGMGASGAAANSGGNVDALRADVEALKARVLAATTPSTTVGAETPLTGLDSSIKRFQAAAVVGPSSTLQRQHVRAGSQSQSRVSRPGSRAPSVTRGSPQADVPSLPSLADDLKESIHGLVTKVNQALAAKIAAPVQGLPTDATTDAWARQAGTMPVMNVPDPAAVSSLDNPGAQEGFLKALQAVQELRERNLSLREENAELAEELLAHDGVMTPSSVQSLHLPRWSPSAQQSASATPSGLLSQTAQLPGVGAGAGALPNGIGSSGGFSGAGMPFAASAPSAGIRDTSPRAMLVPTTSERPSPRSSLARIRTAAAAALAQAGQQGQEAPLRLRPTTQPHTAAQTSGLASPQLSATPSAPRQGPNDRQTAAPAAGLNARPVIRQVGMQPSAAGSGRVPAIVGGRPSQGVVSASGGGGNVYRPGVRR